MLLKSFESMLPTSNVLYLVCQPVIAPLQPLTGKAQSNPDSWQFSRRTDAQSQRKTEDCVKLVNHY